jgi:hypothetical protein
MSFLAKGLVDAFFDRQVETLGQWLMEGKRRLAVPRLDEDSYLQAAHVLATQLSPTRDVLESERTEHLYLVNLLGDPLLKLPRPQTVALAVDHITDARRVYIAGEAPLAGSLVLELCYARDRQLHRPKRRSNFDGRPDVLESYQQTYLQANQSVCGRTIRQVQPGTFQAEIEIPPGANGRCHVRAFVQGDHQYALGAAALTIPDNPGRVGSTSLEPRR